MSFSLLLKLASALITVLGHLLQAVERRRIEQAVLKELSDAQKEQLARDRARLETIRAGLADLSADELRQDPAGHWRD